MIQNSEGNLILAAGKPILLRPVSYAEMMATWLGVCEAVRSLPASTVYLEEDSSCF